MSAPLIDPFDLGRNNLRFALHLLTVAGEYRQQMCGLEEKRIERDLDAIHRERDALANAKDINELASASQDALRNYLQKTANLWQEAAGVTMRNQGAWGEAVSDAIRNWQSMWTTGFQRPSSGLTTAPVWLGGFGAAFPNVQTSPPGAQPAAAAPVSDRHAA